MALASKPITAEDRAERIYIWEQALASIRLEGLDLDPETQALYKRYVDGELTLDQVGEIIDDRDDRKFGPVPVTRHDDSPKPS